MPPNQEEAKEEFIKKVGDEISSIDIHYINAIGSEGTVAEQIIRRYLNEFLAHQEAVRESDIEKLKKEVTYDNDGFCEICGFYSQVADEAHGCVCYNEAIDDILALLKNK